MRGWGCFKKRMPRARVCQAEDNGATFTVPGSPSALHATALLLLFGIKRKMSVLQTAFEDAALKLHRKKSVFLIVKLGFSS